MCKVKHCLLWGQLAPGRSGASCEVGWLNGSKHESNSTVLDSYTAPPQTKENTAWPLRGCRSTVHKIYQKIYQGKSMAEHLAAYKCIILIVSPFMSLCNYQCNFENVIILFFPSAHSFSEVRVRIHQRPCITRQWTPAVVCLGWLDMYWKVWGVLQLWKRRITKWCTLSTASTKLSISGTRRASSLPYFSLVFTDLSS
jgi:hypothetical protein